MSTIKVTPEQLHHVSNQVDQARQQLEHIRSELTRQIMFVQMMWMGATQERFYYEFEQSRPILDKALESMVGISKELKEIATRFENVDAEKVSLGSAVGAVGAGVMMKTLGNDASTEDKGYRMAQVNVYGKLMWMPVNENGVTDQAALQAYKKDQGHLDINRMQATDAEAPGEDIYAMQIKAFENGIHPFTGEPVSDKYAQIMLTSLKFSQLFMAFQMVRGSMPGGKGPFRLPSSHPAVAKIKKNLEARKANEQKKGSEVTGQVSKSVISEHVSDAEKLQRPYDHLVNVDGFKRGSRPGVSGGHNMDKFNETLQEDANKYGLSVKKDYFIGEPNKHNIEGIYEVEYQIPSLKRSESDKSIFEPITDTNGNVVGKRVNDPKTVYDPNIISNEKMYNWGKAALEPQIQAGNVKNGIVKGELNGLKFVGFVDEKGNIKNFYPAF
ncbi:WXG100 family type VII secretion target [Paenibacillus sp. FSL K6-4396]|uniref:WXG100 family type VII secretion target n=1 Tax=unclassified Paenibacillus TaxID=185978 RepID=UPI001783E477|nr:WXG100 family type VII secretion target [Paenibacillus sp. CFBP 13594]MBD8839656.1 WXG100 family type VII secretion target [Paenibacillus sp. CFBP 13594]